MNKKKIMIISIISIIIILICILCISLVNRNDYMLDPIPEIGNEVLIDDLNKEYVDKKDKIEEIYNKTPQKPYTMLHEGKKKNVTDITMLFEYFPSQDLTNKEGLPITEEDDEELFEIANNPKDFDHLLLEETKPIKKGDNFVYPHKVSFHNFDFGNRYGYKQPDKTGYTVSKTKDMYKNTKDVIIVEDWFPSKEAYYQACYDIMLEMIDKIPKNKSITECLPSTVSFYDMTIVRDAYEEGNYDVMFDAIMNKTLIFAFTDNNGVFYRMEPNEAVMNFLGKPSNRMEFRTEYKFDNENKFHK